LSENRNAKYYRPEENRNKCIKEFSIWFHKAQPSLNLNQIDTIIHDFMNTILENNKNVIKIEAKKYSIDIHKDDDFDEYIIQLTNDSYI